jgi:hypothetical protein
MTAALRPSQAVPLDFDFFSPSQSSSDRMNLNLWFTNKYMIIINEKSITKYLIIEYFILRSFPRHTLGLYSAFGKHVHARHGNG